MDTKRKDFQPESIQLLQYSFQKSLLILVKNFNDRF